MKKSCIILLFALVALFCWSCKQNIPQYVPVTDIELDRSLPVEPLTLHPNKTYQLRAKAKPDAATDKKLTYTSSAKNIASVSDTGLITAHSVGAAKITISAADGISKEIGVAVQAAEVPVTGIETAAIKNPLSIVKGAEYTLAAKAIPDTATNKRLTYASSDERIVVVNAEGTVTAKEIGTAKITISAANGISKEIGVVVQAGTVAVTGIELNAPPVEPLALHPNKTYQLTAKATPETATDKTLTYASSAPSVASVSNAGLITARSAGSAIITITTANGISKKIRVTVTMPEIPVTGIVFTPPLSADTLPLSVGRTYQLWAKAVPETATNKTLTYTSSANDVASVSSAGMITACSVGRAKITISAAGGISKEIRVSVSAADVAVTGIAVSAAENPLSIVKGAEHTLTAKAVPDTATNKRLAYASSDERIVSVDGSGKVTAKETGQAKITISAANGITKTINVTVTAGTVAVTGIELNPPPPEPIALHPNKTYQLWAKAKPEAATNKTLQYSSSAPGVASVSNTGLITAHSAGSAKITIRAADGIFQEIGVVVTIAPVAVTDITFDPALPGNPLPLSVGGSCLLHAKVLPENATDKNLSYHAENAEIASVNADGLVTAKAAGQTKITIRASNNISKDVPLSVTAVRIPVTGIVLSPDADTISLTQGERRKLNAQVTPENASKKTLIYSSDDARIATVNEDGVIAAKAAGRTRITINAADGISKAVAVTVIAAHVPVTGISLSPDESFISLVRGAQRELNAQVTPENASNKMLAYNSDDAGVASVDAAGRIAAHNAGSARITINAADGVSRVVTVNVRVPVTDIAFAFEYSASPIELTVGDNYKLDPKALPDDATNKELRISSSDPDTAWPNGDGNAWVKALKDGNVTITVTSVDNPNITKAVQFVIKRKPQIKYESMQAVMPESAAGTYTFEVQTIDGKLDYEPCFTSNKLPWITGAPTIASRDNPDKDEISFTCAENKTVWDRRAYIKFKDVKTGQYVKGADGKTDLTVNIIQKKNENPVIHYKWVDGIGSPAENEKEKVGINNNGIPTGETYPQSYVFKWKETANTKFYNVRKLDKLYVQGQFPNDYFVIKGIRNEQIQGRDLSQCWAKTASNMLHWWFEQNKDYIDQYKQKASIEAWKLPLYDHKYKRGLSDEDENKKSNIANIFRAYTHNKSQGGYIEDGLTWYLYQRDAQKKLGSIYPGLFNDVFTHDTSPITIERCETKNEFEQLMNQALDNKRAIGIFWQGRKGNRPYQHAVTCWGAAYDEENNIICLYIAESNLTEAVLYPFGVRYKGNIYEEAEKNRTYMFNYALSKPEDIYIDGLTTLDKGEDQWKEWLRTH